MIAGIVGVPSRSEHISDLRRIIEPEVDSVHIFMDEDYKGHWWNLRRTIESMTSMAKTGEPVLILSDDAITIPGWRSAWEKIHSCSNDKIYILFGRQRHLFSEDNIRRGYVKKVQLRGFYDQAFVLIDQGDFMERVIDWFNDKGRLHRRLVRRSKHLDVVIQEYLTVHNIPWTISTPSIFNHKQIDSTLGHPIGGSPCYIGDRSDR